MEVRQSDVDQVVGAGMTLLLLDKWLKDRAADEWWPQKTTNLAVRLQETTASELSVLTSYALNQQ